MKRFLFHIVVSGLLSMVLSQERKSYEGYEVWSITPRTKNELALMKNIETAIPKVDVWQEASQIGREVHVMVSPDNKQEAKALLDTHNMGYTIKKTNLQSKIDEELDRFAQRPDTFVHDYNDFNTYEDIMTELDSLASRCNAAGFYCLIEDWGNSHEGREIKALKMITDDANPYFYLDSLTHAREWMSGATLMNIVNIMVSDADGDNHEYMRRYNWIVVPVVNPDGYVHSWDVDRYWRKSRKPNAGVEDCPGTDLNRNFDADWATAGSSQDPCTTTYHGQFAADNAETQAIQDVIDTYRPMVGLTFHTYGYYWLEPYATGAYPPHVEYLNAVTELTVRSIELTFGDLWRGGNFAEVLYEASGTTGDYLMDSGVLTSVYAWTPELRGDDFVIDASQIPFSVEEIWNGMRAKMDAIDALPE